MMMDYIIKVGLVTYKHLKLRFGINYHILSDIYQILSDIESTILYHSNSFIKPFVYQLYYITIADILLLIQNISEIAKDCRLL